MSNVYEMRTAESRGVVERASTLLLLHARCRTASASEAVQKISRMNLFISHMLRRGRFISDASETETISPRLKSKQATHAGFVAAGDNGSREQDHANLGSASNSSFTGAISTQLSLILVSWSTLRSKTCQLLPAKYVVIAAGLKYLSPAAM